MGVGEWAGWGRGGPRGPIGAGECWKGKGRQSAHVAPWASTGLEPSGVQESQECSGIQGGPGSPWGYRVLRASRGAGDGGGNENWGAEWVRVSGCDGLGVWGVAMQHGHRHRCKTRIANARAMLGQSATCVCLADTGATYQRVCGLCLPFKAAPRGGNKTRVAYSREGATVSRARYP